MTELVEFYEGKGWPYTGKDILAIDYEDWKEKRTKEKMVARESVPNGFVAYITDVIIPYWTDRKNLSNAEKYRLES